MKLSVLIPAYNEEQSVEAVVRRVAAVELGGLGAPVALELIVVDDCSTDATTGILARLSGGRAEAPPDDPAPAPGGGGGVATLTAVATGGGATAVRVATPPPPPGAGAGSSGGCLLYTSPSPRDLSTSRMPSSA